MKKWQEGQDSLSFSISFPDEKCENPRSKAADVQAAVSSQGLAGAEWQTRSSEWNLRAVSCLLTYRHTGSFLPVCNLLWCPFPSLGSLAGFEAGLYSSEGPLPVHPKMSVVIWLYTSSSVIKVGRLQDHRDQTGSECDGEPRFALLGLFHQFWWIMHGLAWSCQCSWSASSYGSSDPNKERTKVAPSLAVSITG